MQTQVQELLTEAKTRLDEARAIAENPDASGEEKEKFNNLATEVVALKNRAAQMSELNKAAIEIEALTKAGPPEPKAPAGEFKSLGHFAQAAWAASIKGRHDDRLKYWHDANEPDTPANGKGWVEGDFDYDSDVDIVDLTALAANWTPVGSAPPVPEPTMLALLAIGGVVLLRRRRA